MKYYVSLLLLLFMAIPMQSCSEEDAIEIKKDTLVTFDKDYDVSLIDDVQVLAQAIQACEESVNRSKTIGVFGGSLSCLPESKATKWLWNHYLGCSIYDYGHYGYGYSSLVGSVQNQVDEAQSHDIYILWCSTNDFWKNQPIGEISDYTEEDGYDESKRVSQCGGLNYCIRHLRQVNPRAKIFIWSSLKFYSADTGNNKESQSVNVLGYNFYDYVVKQNELAQANDIPHLDQFDFSCMTEDKVSRFYKEDKTHMTEEGYLNIGVYQLLFLATH